jgi:hypothetical protein
MAGAAAQMLARFDRGAIRAEAFYELSGVEDALVLSVAADSDEPIFG